MLTRELLQFTLRKGRIRPRFLQRADPELRALAASLVALAEAAPGRPVRELDEAMSALALGYARPRVGRGLVKLLQDRCTVEAPGEEGPRLRAEVFAASMAALSEVGGAGGEASPSAYEARIEARLGRPLSEVRAALFADLPDARRVEAFDPIGAARLLERYDLAQAQGLLVYAERLELALPGLDRPEVRRLLRWLRFFRLVAAVETTPDGIRLGVEGPAAMFEGTKRYGLQLASFFGAVPALPEWRLEAEVRLPRRPAARLELDRADPLVPGFGGGPGHVPPELVELSRRAELPGWRIDPAPPPRVVGATDLAVPDFALEAEDGRARLVVELFHRWHRGALGRRLAQLAEVPEADYRIGVDRVLLKDPELAGRIEAHPQAFSFRDFPTQRALRALVRDAG